MQLPKGLYKRGNSYYIDYKDETGRRIRRSVGQDLHHAMSVLQSVRDATYRRGDVVGLGVVLESYLSRQRIYSKKRSVKAAESSARRLLLHLGDVPVSRLDQRSVDEFVRFRLSKKLRPKTVNNDLIVLRAALNHAVKASLIEALPFRVTLVRGLKRKVVKPLSAQELERVLDMASGRIHGILLVAMYTGFRTSEILHLQWRDIDWEVRSIQITTKPGVWSSKNHQERSVFVPPTLIEWLAKFRSSAAESTASVCETSTSFIDLLDISSPPLCRRLFYQGRWAWRRPRTARRPLRWAYPPAMSARFVLGQERVDLLELTLLRVVRVDLVGAAREQAVLLFATNRSPLQDASDFAADGSGILSKAPAELRPECRIELLLIARRQPSCPLPDILRDHLQAAQISTIERRVDRVLGLGEQIRR